MHSINNKLARIDFLSGKQQQVLENILDVLHTDQDNSRRESILLQDLVQDTLCTMAPIAHNKHITLIAELHYTGSLEVHPDLFQQVLKHLVGNAINCSRPGSIVKISINRRNDQTLLDVTCGEPHACSEGMGPTLTISLN